MQHESSQPQRRRSTSRTKYDGRSYAAKAAMRVLADVQATLLPILEADDTDETTGAHAAPVLLAA
jgi:hypothetical protein